LAIEAEGDADGAEQEKRDIHPFRPPTSVAD
jgi:hypothetical protein